MNHSKVQEIIDKVRSGEMEAKEYKIQIDDEYFTYISFYPNKQTWYIHNFKNGSLHGKSEGWFSNGNRDYIVNYKNGSRHGNFYGWNEDGTKKYERTYKNGKLIVVGVYL